MAIVSSEGLRVANTWQVPGLLPRTRPWTQCLRDTRKHRPSLGDCVAWPGVFARSLWLCLVSPQLLRTPVP